MAGLFIFGALSKTTNQAGQDMGRVSFEVPEVETKIFFMNTLKPMDPVTGQRKC